MPRLSIEILEDRITPTTVSLAATEGRDIWFVYGSGPATMAASLQLNGNFALSFMSLSNATSVRFDGLGGDDILYHSSPIGLLANMGAGNDVIAADGAEGGSVQASGGPGDDLLIGASQSDFLFGDSGRDVLIGGPGADSLYGGGGEDLLITDSLLSTITPYEVTQIWSDNVLSRPERMVKTIRNVQGSSDGATDYIGDTLGFDLIYDGSAGRRFQVGTELLGAIRFASNVPDFLHYVSIAEPGDIIQLAAGTYTLSNHIWGDLSGVTIRGAGMGQTILQGGSFRLENGGGTAPTLLQNMTLDLTGQSAISGYLNFAGGSFILDGMEVKGIGQTDTAAVVFRKNASGPTNGLMINSYVHDTLGDLISTSGNSQNLQDAATSLVELYDNTAHTSGPNSQDQVLSAHFGLRLVDVGGEYWDASENVVAPDGNTRLDLYLTTIYPGARRGNVVLSTANSVIDGATITANYIQPGALLQNSILINSENISSALVRPVFSGSVVKNNRIVQTLPTTSKKGVLSTAPNVQVIDNIFENWDGDEWQLLGTGSIATGNIII